MKFPPTLSLLACFFCTFVLGACCVTERQTETSRSDGRVYNPQTRDYEWQNRSRSSTSPGADGTRRSSNF